MAEVRRLFQQMKQRVRFRREDEPDKTTTAPATTTRLKEPSTETKKRDGGSGSGSSFSSSIRRTPDLIKSHPQTKLPPLPQIENSSHHGIIRGYPAVSGHIYEEITTDNPVPSPPKPEAKETGRGGVFYISPIDGALHRLKPEVGDRIVCPHLRFDCDSSTLSQPLPASFTRTLFGKELRVCEKCAISLRERFVSGDPDVIYPTYWRSMDLEKLSIPCPNLPENLVYDGDINRDQAAENPRWGECNEERMNRSFTEPSQQSHRGFSSRISNSVRSKSSTMIKEEDEEEEEIAIFDKLSCRATNYRLPRAEARLLGNRSVRGHRFPRPHDDRVIVATSRSMNNLLLSDILRMNHDRQCLRW